MDKYAHELHKDLAANSLAIDVETKNVHLDGSAELVSQTYLRVRGAPEGFRWLAKLLNEMADNKTASAIVSGNQLDTINLKDWDSLDLSCNPESIPRID